MQRTVTFPTGVTAEQKGTVLSVKGPKGALERDFVFDHVNWTLDGDKLTIASTSDRKKIGAGIGTLAAHVQNMITGVTVGFEASLKVVYAHFPIKVTVQGTKVVVSNFLGERSDRITEAAEGVKVEVKKDDVFVSGPDKDKVGQTAGRIEGVARVTGFDKRVFMDGIHLVQKAHPRK